MNGIFAHCAGGPPREQAAFAKQMQGKPFLAGRWEGGEPLMLPAGLTMP
jgi:hypothetical protein